MPTNLSESGMNNKYLVTQLKKFKKIKRFSYNPDDLSKFNRAAIFDLLESIRECWIEYKNRKNSFVPLVLSQKSNPTSFYAEEYKNNAEYAYVQRKEQTWESITAKERNCARWIKSFNLPRLMNVSESKVFYNLTDGIALCQLVSALERISVDIMVTDCVENIRTALNVLKFKKEMPIDYLWSEYDIFEGNEEVTKRLMLQIMDVYEKAVI